ncbi:hypothetical protein [Algicola sagamiensis]|uniref:hypothetical protein n=1 Tax=Algicola sagamiensis TaxID=163869 RepID=UPI0003682290|nr:hypothetical protein [Algicola sagamiensis]
MIFVLLSLIFSLLLYFEAIKAGMPAKRWFVLGALTGPLAWPLFNVHRRRAILRATRDDDYECRL